MMIPTVETLAVKLGELEKRIAERFAAQDKAETIADRELAAWKHAHNDAFSALSRSYAEKLSREEYVVQHQALIEKVDKIEETLRIQLGDSNRRIGLNESRISTVEGRSTGVQASLGWIISAIALAVSLYALLSGHPVMMR